MASPNILRRNKNGSGVFARKSGAGFTLIEILISVTILATLFGLGLFVSFDFYRSYALASEKNTIVSVLQKARGESLNNIGQVRHGVHFQTTAPLQYILFECPAGNPQCTNYTASASDISVPASYGITLIAPVPDIIFDQLSGDCVTCQNPTTTITANDGTRSYNITINSEGQIDW